VSITGSMVAGLNKGVLQARALLEKAAAAGKERLGRPGSAGAAAAAGEEGGEQ
jgi:hypothetical protein